MVEWLFCSRGITMLIHKLCHDAHCVLGLHFSLIGPQYFLLYNTWDQDHIGSQPISGFRKYLQKEKRDVLKKMYPHPQFPFLIGKGLGRGGSGGDTISSDALISHDNCWEEAAFCYSKSCPQIKKVTDVLEAVLPPLAPAWTSWNLRQAGEVAGSQEWARLKASQAMYCIWLWQSSYRWR